MLSELTDLEQSLLGHLQCPVCLEYMRPPITLCAVGHNICNICKQKMYHCPVCRQHILGTRNLSLEDVASHVKFPCKYRSYGCKEVFANDAIIGHQDQCSYCPQRCPVPALNSQKCNWTGNYDQIMNHLKKQHGDKCCDYAEEIVWTVKCFHAVVFYYQFLFAFDEVFFQRFVKKGDTFYPSVHYIGHAENAAKYKYRVEFFNKDNTEGVTVMHLTRSFKNKMENFLSTDNCSKLHYDVVSRLKNEVGDLNYKIEICRVGD
jgi:RING-finger-containing E3 ubiquitin ligase